MDKGHSFDPGGLTCLPLSRASSRKVLQLTAYKALQMTSTSGLMWVRGLSGGHVSSLSGFQLPKTVYYRPFVIHGQN